MKIAIVGSREYPDLEAVYEFVLSLPIGTVVVSGGARGVDRTAEDTAKSRGLEVISIRPEWGKYGKRAGFIRNTEIVRSADLVVAFWDGKSRGTKDTIRQAKKLDVPTYIYLPPVSWEWREDLWAMG